MSARRKRGDGCVYLRGRIWWVKYSVNGKFTCESSESDKEVDARKLLKKRMGEMAIGRFIGPDAERVTIRELAEDYLNDYRVNERKSLDKAERMVKRHDDEGKEIDSELMSFLETLRRIALGRTRSKNIRRKNSKPAPPTQRSTASWRHSKECLALASKLRKSSESPTFPCSRKTM